MSFSEDNLLSKLSTLNETQESIVAISQYVLFHRRYAVDIARIWADYILKTPMSKRLALVYLANEVVQQAKAKKKPEFTSAFSSIICPTLEAAYNAAPNDIQTRIKRVVDVWVQRRVFDDNVLRGLKEAIGEINGPSNGIGGTGGGDPGGHVGVSAFGSFGGGGGGGGPAHGSPSIPDPLIPLCSLQKSISSGQASTDGQVGSVRRDYRSLFDSDCLPAPQEYASRLNSLSDQLSNAKSSLRSLITSRKAMIVELNNLLTSCESDLSKCEKELLDIEEKEIHVAETKEEVESMLVDDGYDPTAGAAVSSGTDGSGAVAGDSTATTTLDASAVNALMSALTGTTSALAADSAGISGSNEIPSYSPLSSDEEDSTPPAKKQKQ